MMNRPRMRTGRAAGATLVVVLLAGCANPADPSQAPSAPTGAAGQPTSGPGAAEPDEPPANAAQVGQVFDTDPGDLAQDMRAYEMPDGSYVAVAADEPLPAQVHSDLVAKGLAVVDVTDVNDNDQLVARSDAAAAYALEQEQATGKKLVMVERLYGYSFASSEVPVWSWYVWSFRDTHNDLVQDYAERDQAVAVAQDWVAARPDPQAWEIVVIE